MPLSAARVLLHPPKRYALSFDGENDYVETSSITIGPPITVEVMFKPSMIPQPRPYPMLITNWIDDADNGFIFRLDNSDPPTLYVLLRKDGAVSAVISQTLTSSITWYYAAFTYDGSVLKLIVNESTTETNVSNALSSVTSRIRLGFKLAVDDGFLGYEAFARIYSQALSASEIQHNYFNPMSPILDGLVLWLKMEEGSGTTVHDYSGYGNDGTIYGASWTEITHDPVRTLSPVRVLSNMR